MKLLLLGVLFTVFVVVKGTTNCRRHGSECPDYEVLEDLEGYQKRRYPEATFVSTSGIARERKTIVVRLIKRLYNYIHGNNSRGARIGLMVPVRTLKSPGSDNNTYTLSFFLPRQFSHHPPMPLDPRVFIHREPCTEYAVRSFGNRVIDDNKWDEKAQFLFDRLPDVDSRDYYWAVYDSPWVQQNRLNEVWVRLNSEGEHDDDYDDDNDIAVF